MVTLMLEKAQNKMKALLTYDGDHKGLVVLWVQRLLDDLRLVDFFAVESEYKVRITCSTAICCHQIFGADQIDSQVTHVYCIHDEIIVRANVMHI